MYLVHIHSVSPIIISYITYYLLILLYYIILYYIIYILSIYYIIFILYILLYTASLSVSMLAHTDMTVTIAFVPLSFCMHACVFVHASCNNQSSASVSQSNCSLATQPVTYVEHLKYMYIKVTPTLHLVCISRLPTNIIMWLYFCTLL